MAPKEKSLKIIEKESPSIAPTDLERIPLVVSLFKVLDSKCEFDFIELHACLKQKYIDQGDEIRFWETHFPHSLCQKLIAS